MKLAESGKGVVSGMTPSRASSSSVAIASGYWAGGHVNNLYAGGTITDIPAASSGKHRYDLIVLDGSTGTISRVAGSEDTPTIISDFLENLQPLPPELTSENQILIAVIIVTSSGIPTGNFGHYATSGVADMTIPVKGQINHVDLVNKGSNTHASIDSHIGSSSNPHSVTAAQVGAPALSLITAVGDVFVGSGAGAVVKRTIAEVKALLGLGSAAYTASSDYTPAAHAGNTNNPHSTTYGQVGAEPANANIQAHIASTSNPHSTTTGQIGAAPAAQGVTDGNNHAHVDGKGGQIAYSSLSGKPTRKFAVPFTYGDGYSVIPTASVVASAEVEIPVACTITAVRIHERFNTTGSILVKLWKRTYSGDWSMLDEYVITDGIRYEETGLSIALAEGDWITAEVSTVSTMKQITCSLTCEPA
jgi:hypothetical protein